MSEPTRIGLGRAARPALSRLGVVPALCLALAGCDGSATTNATPGSRAGTPPPAAPAIPATPAPATVEGDRLAGSVLAVTAPPTSREPSPFRFTDVARQSGIDFVHFSGVTPEKHFPTQNGSGVAIFDHDGDGRMDLYFATCTLLPPGTARKGPNRLYRNQGDGTFRDVTESSGLGFAGFCHGIVVGDIDNDGDPDVFLCNYGPNVLYLNEGQGRFVDISHAAGIDRPGWSSCGAFLDYDGDGDLDLYVANYGEWSYPEDDLFCGDKPKNIRLFCSPLSIRTTRHFLYRNNGDKTFTEASAAAGITRADGHGFGVLTADLNGDGKIDIYVANDMNPNFLYLNKGDGTFEDVTAISGAGLDGRGQAQSGMGVDAEDIDGDGLPELFVTNFQNEYNTLYANLGDGNFLDATAFVGLSSDSLPWVGWGCAGRFRRRRLARLLRRQRPRRRQPPGAGAAGRLCRAGFAPPQRPARPPPLRLRGPWRRSRPILPAGDPRRRPLFRVDPRRAGSRVR